MDGHHAPEPVDPGLGHTVDVKAGPGQALLQFAAAERVHMGVVGPGQ